MDFAWKEGLPQLDRTGVASLVDYATVLANDKEKISTKFNDLSEILGEAATWANLVVLNWLQINLFTKL